jgi:hypothetical protein
VCCPSWRSIRAWRISLQNMHCLRNTARWGLLLIVNFVWIWWCWLSRCARM